MKRFSRDEVLKAAKTSAASREGSDSEPHVISEPAVQSYSVSLTQKQIDILTRALDLYFRIGLGQLDRISDEFADRVDDSKDMEAVRDHLDIVKFELTGFAPNASYGIRSAAVPERFKIAYDMYGIIMHHLVNERQDGYYSVYSARHLMVGSEPVIDVTKK